MSDLGSAIGLLGVRVVVVGVGAIAMSIVGFAGCRLLRTKVFVRPVFDHAETTSAGAFRLLALFVLPGGAAVTAGLLVAILGVGIYYSAAIFT